MEDYLQSEEEDEEEWNKSLLDNPSSINSISTSKQNLVRQINLADPIINNASSSKLNSARQIKHPRCIVHIDIDCFYAQVEMIKNPELRNVPMGVKQKNLVVTTNYPARNKGVPKSCWIPDALKICPDLVLINGEDLHDYRQYSQRIFELLKSFKVPVEKLGLDENFLDVTNLVSAEDNSYNRDNAESVSTIKGHCFRSQTETDCKCGCNHRLKLASDLAQQIREKLFDELSITTSAGIGHNKLLSKMIGSRHKPNDQTTIFPCDVTSFLDEVSDVGKLPGIGSVTTKKLKENGLGKIRDIVTCGEQRIRHLFSSDLIVANKILKFCSGLDDSPVVMSQPAKSIGVEDRFKGIDKRDQCITHLEWLFDRLCLLIHEDGRMPSVIKISARDFEKAKSLNNKFMRETRQAKISSDLFKSLTTDSKLEPIARGKVLKICSELLAKIVDLDSQFRLTLLGVSVTGFNDNQRSNHHQGKHSITSFFGDHVVDSTSLQSFPNRFDQKKRNLQVDGEPDSCLSPPVKVKCLVFAGGKHKQSTEDSESSLGKCLSTTTITAKRVSRQLTTTTSNIIPTDWDKDVFQQLPHDVQQELLTNADISKSINVKSSSSVPADKVKINGNKKQSTRIISSTTRTTLSNSSRKINELFAKSTSFNSGKNISSMNYNNNTNNSNNLDNYSNNSKNSSKTIINKNNYNNNENSTIHDNKNLDGSNIHSNNNTLPSSNWDKDVFQQLPPELQQELLASQHQQQSIQRKTNTTNSTTSKTNKPKQNNNKNSNNIFTYFQKK